MTSKFQDINFNLDNLPPMPIVASQILELINSPEASVNRLAKIVSRDQAVSARVLKIANSSFYSMSRQVSTLSTAIVILGERTLKNLVLAASMRGMHQSFGNIEKMLWEDSMVCALGSRFLASKLQTVDPEEAFMAGLFRHIGKVVINSQAKDDKGLLQQMVAAECTELAARERLAFGATHAEVGAAVLESWKLSETMSLVALHHFDMEVAGITDRTAINIIGLVNIADAFPDLFRVFGAPKEIDLAARPGAEMLNLDAERLHELSEEFRSVLEANREEFFS